MDKERLLTIFDCLLGAYGPQRWWPADGPLEVIVGAILTQRTSWQNAARALVALREAGLTSTIGALVSVPESRLHEAVRPSGCYRAKSKKLKAFATTVAERHRGDLSALLRLPLEPLREELLAIHGIGPETADAILVYAAGHPSFVVDAYTRRLFERLGSLSGGESYGDVQALFSPLPPDADLFGEFHALIVQHGKTHCRVCPSCGGCPLAEMCPSELCERSV
jgi:endonuclease-3 related protein